MIVDTLCTQLDFVLFRNCTQGLLTYLTVHGSFQQFYFIYKLIYNLLFLIFDNFFAFIVYFCCQF